MESFYCVLLLLSVINSSMSTKVTRASGTGWPSYYAQDFGASPIIPAIPAIKKAEKAPATIPSNIPGSDYKAFWESWRKTNRNDQTDWWNRFNNNNNPWWSKETVQDMPQGWSKYYTQPHSSYREYYPQISNWDTSYQYNNNPYYPRNSNWDNQQYSYPQYYNYDTKPQYPEGSGWDNRQYYPQVSSWDINQQVDPVRPAVKQENPSLINRDGRRNEGQQIKGDQPQSITSNNQAAYPPITKSLCPQNDFDGVKRYAYHRIHKKCYEIGSKGPCKTNMRFYLEETGSNYGSCDCDAKIGYGCGRPLVYWEKHDWCYPINSQGPCKFNEWLILDNKSQPVCKLNDCVEQQQWDNSKDSDCEHWTSVKGKCFRTSTQGYCHQDELLFWDIFDTRSTEPKCTSTKNLPDPKYPQFSPINRIDRSLPCLPGQKQNFLGRCLSYYRYQSTQ